MDWKETTGKQRREGIRRVCEQLIPEKDHCFSMASSHSRWGVLEVPISDPRTGVDSRINSGAIGLRDLNASGTATAILVTTFDWPEPGDLLWFQDQLQLPRSVEATLCAHLWPLSQAGRDLWLELSSCFDTAVLHFTGMAEFSQPGAGEVEEPSKDDWVTGW